MPDLTIKLKNYQDEFIFSEARFPALVAAIGTGKTMCGIMKVMRAMEAYRNNLGIVVRKEYTDLKDSTIKDFEDYTGKKVTDKDCKINGGTILFRHGAEINVLKNINAGIILIEQAEEFESDEQFIFLRDRLRRGNVDKRSLNIIANTNGHNWIHKLWKLNLVRDPNFHLTEATTYDNADNLPADFIADQQSMERTHPAHYNRYVMNSWEDVDTVDNVVQPKWVEKAIKKDVLIKAPIKKVISIDVARQGDDKTQYRAIEHSGNQYNVFYKFTHEKKNTMETVARAILLGEKLGINAYAVDEIGMGEGVADRLVELKKEVIFVNGARASRFPDKYRNARAEIYANAGELLEQGLVQLLDDDDEANEELVWARYKELKSSGKVLIEPKEDIKKRHGRSPDGADTIVNGLWAVENVSIAVASTRYGKKVDSDYHLDPDTV